MSAKSKKRIKELSEASSEYFSSDRQRLVAQFSFLDSISKKRGAGISLQDLNSETASVILANSINDYLGRIS